MKMNKWVPAAILAAAAVAGLTVLSIKKLASAKRQVHKEILSVSLETQPAWGMEEDMERTVTTIYADGSVLREVFPCESDQAKFTEMAWVNVDKLEPLWTVVNGNGFFSFPQEIEGGVQDGYYIHLTVETPDGIYTSGGLVADAREDFRGICEAFRQIAEPALPPQ